MDRRPSDATQTSEVAEVFAVVGNQRGQWQRPPQDLQPRPSELRVAEPQAEREDAEYTGMNPMMSRYSASRTTADITHRAAACPRSIVHQRSRHEVICPGVKHICSGTIEPRRALAIGSPAHVSALTK